MAGNGRRGRPSKGDRIQKTMRFPAEHYAVYEAAAARAGLDFNAYVNWALARFHGLPIPDGEPDAGDQVEIPFEVNAPRELEGAA